MNSALADKEFVLSLHHKLHVSTCINKPNDVYTNTINQFFTQSINHFYINNNETFLRDETILKTKSNFTLLLYIPFLGIAEWYFKCVLFILKFNQLII